jgi:hypothetical protein
MVQIGTMMNESRRWRPSDVDHVALLATLHCDPFVRNRAAQRWCEIQRAAPLSGSDRLFPLLRQSARLHGWEDPGFEAIRERSRSIATFSYLVRVHARSVLHEIGLAGFRPVVLKGLALQSMVYSEINLRPITDVDILLNASQAIGLLAHLEETGWRTNVKRVFGPGRFASYAGMNLGRAPFESLDVHWKLSHWSRDPQQSERMMQRAIPFVLDGQELRTLDRCDHLVHTIVHGIAWESGASIRWVADAVALLNAGPIEWDRVVEECSRGGFAPALREALLYLREELAVELPFGLVSGLRARRTSPVDALTHRIRTAPRSRMSMLARLLVTDFAARTAGETARRRVRGYPSYLFHTLADEGLPMGAALRQGARRQLGLATLDRSALRAGAGR